ncbi:MAG: F0F1 ATP synthase subunit B [Erysipelotrichaceae bacterium]
MLELDIAGKLFPDALTMIVQLAATGVLFYGFHRLLWKPIIAYLEKRAVLADSQLREAEASKLNAEKLHAEAQVQLTEAIREAHALVERGKEEGQRVREKLSKDGKTAADLKLQSALREITYQRQQMEDSIQTEIVDVALLAARKLIEDKADETFDRDQVERFLKDVRS